MPLSEWGAFDRPTARCQRALLTATVRCARNAWEVRRSCLAADLAGGSCDAASTNARIVDVRRDALDLVDLYCSERQLGELGFLGQFDMQTDVIAACRSWEDLLESATYAAVETNDAACADMATRVLTCATSRLFDRWSRTLRFVATRELSLERKEVRIEREEARAAALVGRTRSALAPFCGAATVEQLSRVVELAVCVPASISVQERVVCPEPICGNGLVEPGEIDDACDPNDVP